MSAFATRSIFAMTLAVASVAVLPLARAVQLDPGGQGQVLLYRYNTVHDHQQTLLSIITTSDSDQGVQVTFHEALNGRSALQFKAWLGRKDRWTGTMFALADDGLANDGATSFPLSSHNYSGAMSDGGPRFPCSITGAAERSRWSSNCSGFQR